MVDFGELWRQEAKLRRAPDDADAWDERARDAVSKYGPSGYSMEFLRLAALQPGESVFDMGCGAGALAIPCAERGHDVVAADFSPAMLERCLAGVPADAPGTVVGTLLAWDDDWEAAGIAPRSADVAFASRSIATADMEAAIVKLSRVACRRVCVTVTAGKTPRVSHAFLHDLGLSCRGHQDASFVFGIAAQLGFRPTVQFIESVRYDGFATPEDAVHAYLDMLRFADDAPAGGDLAHMHAQASAWVEAHLREGPAPQAPDADAVREVERSHRFHIDVPRTFSWAFLAWDV